jgi:hypothetical protein
MEEFNLILLQDGNHEGNIPHTPSCLTLAVRAAYRRSIVAFCISANRCNIFLAMRWAKYDGITVQTFEKSFGEFVDHPMVVRCLEKLRLDFNAVFGQVLDETINYSEDFAGLLSSPFEAQE